MNITPRSLALTDLKPMEAEHFTGKAGSRELIRASQQTRSAFAAVVRFETGVRNYWHSHAGGQLLHVIEGEGWVRLAAPSPSGLVRVTPWRPSRTRSTGTAQAVAGPWPTSPSVSARRAGWRSHLLRRTSRPAFLASRTQRKSRIRDPQY